MRTLLLVDDSGTTLAVEKAFLETRDIRVFATRSASEALTLAGVVQPDLIVADFEMPEMTGDELCRRLKASESTRQIPVLILSSHEEERIVRTCLDAGATGYVRKREGREALLDRVAEVLGIRQRRHPRVTCRIPAVLGSRGERFEGTIHNLSAGGLYITLDEGLDVGAPVWITFALPDETGALRVLGEVVRAEALSGSLRAHGVQLLQADDRTVERLEAFVQGAIAR